MSYTNKFKQVALDLVNTIGITKASEQLHVNKVTLRNWRKKIQNEPVPQDPDTQKAPENSPKEQQYALIKKLQAEIQEQQKLNQKCQETIEHLANENVALRQQCERYLNAISIISSTKSNT